MLLFIFISIIIKINHFIFNNSRNSVLHTFASLVPCGYNVFLSKVCNLLLSLLLSAILLISSEYTLCTSFLNTEKTMSHLYFNEESGSFKENTCENEVFCSTIERN